MLTVADYLLADFTPLPLVEVENTLSNEENTFLVTSSSASSTFDLSAKLMSKDPRFQQCSSFPGNSQMQCGYNFGSAASCKELGSDNTFKGETAVTTYSGFPGSFNHKMQSS